MKYAKPKFLYFDLGNVLLFFDHRKAARQLAALAGVDERQIYEGVFRTDLNFRCDAGEVGKAEFCRLFRERFPCQAADEALIWASSDIFHVNTPMKAITAQLEAAGNRIGLLSNTCDMHYDFFSDGRFSTITESFETVVLSYRLRLMKPDRAIYLAAARLAEVEPSEVFYVDDLPANVEGAKAAGFDAVLYTTPAAYLAELRARDIRLNY
ncbi:MAG: HAD family phosphatase [Planctomycetia bacterium]|nr:HAD family phosphatase [Planctomycetia bacterium]